ENTRRITTDSFIFSFDYNDLKNATVSRINHDNKDYAIVGHEDYGPWFGEGPDLRVPNNNSFGNFWELKTKSYAKIAKVDLLTVLDYEVFQIVSNVTEKST
ncbi:37304_t:CDS:1, partial [Gigaspora margarita]